MTQKEALDLLKLGHNVFLTGAAGSGKTYLLNQYISYLRSEKVGVARTASTGIAATHMNGVTIHSWSAIRIKKEITATDLKKLLRDDRLHHRFRKAKVLIIDEVSMLHAFRLDMVDKVLKAFKQSDLPFGGLQVILCGDFFQLPPVSSEGEDPSFVHKSRVWDEMDLRVCYLTEQHRQEDDDFLKVLGDIRDDSVEESTLEHLVKRLNQEIEGVSKPTKLYTHNANVDAINDAELQKLKGKPMTYRMYSQGEESLVKGLKKGCMAPEELILKKDAVVMFVKNNPDRGYINGTLGKVVNFDSENRPVVQTLKGRKIIATPEQWTVEENDRIIAKISQIPLRLAWAITVHKSQGMSLDAAEIDLSKSFEPGMGYVALSRVRTLAGLKLMGMNDMAMRISGEAFSYDRELRKASEAASKELAAMPPDDVERQQQEFIKSVQEKSKSRFEKLKEQLLGA